MSGILRPSAGYIGRGVTAKSAELYMLYHQKSLAQVKAGSRFLAASHTFSPETSAFDCRHSHTSARSRKYQPLATMPCSLGIVPVKNVDCTEHVTAGVMDRSARHPPCSARRRKLGASARCSLVSPTTSSTT